jgi:hypothetical protein
MITLAKLIASLLMLNSIFFFWRSISDPDWIVKICYPTRGDLNLISLTAINYEKRWRDRRQFFYVIATAIGFGLMTYWIANGLLNFLPDNFGSRDEDGQFVSTRMSISALFGLLGAGFIPKHILDSAIKKIRNDVDK